MSTPADKKAILDEFLGASLHEQLGVYEMMVRNLESPTQDHMQNFTSDAHSCRMLHAAIGIASESGEMMDLIKKTLAYGKPIDITNFLEELGDVLWYVHLGAIAAGVSLESIMAMNYAKLKLRYGEKFSVHACFNRDLEVERTNLEASTAAIRSTDL